MRGFYDAILTLCCLLVILPSAAQTSSMAKMSPWVRQVVSRDIGAHHRASGRQESPTMTVFMEVKEEADVDSLLALHNGRKHAQIGRIAIVSIPICELAALSAHPSVNRIEARQLPRTTMDTVPSIVNLLPVYEYTTEHPAFTGNGVIMGIMDIGFDLSHPTFRQAGNTSQYRIKALWDQLSSDTIGSTLPVGRSYTNEEEIVALGCVTDGHTQTHGTHTAGIAAGTGYDTPYRGVAFDSDLCLVANAVSDDTLYISKDDYYKYTTATDALGFKYLFDYADSQGKPCVASFSEGYTAMFDEEDRLFSQFLDGLVGPGRIICVAAGNENRAKTRAVKPAETEEEGAFVFSYYQQATYRVQADGPLNIVLHNYSLLTDGQPSTLTIASDDGRMDSLLTDTLQTAEGHWWALAVTRYPSAFSADDIYYMELSSDIELEHTGLLAISIEGLGTNAVLYGSGTSTLRNRPDIDPRWQGATSGCNILAPATFPAVITVGATSHRTGFVNVEGNYKNPYGIPADGLLAFYSSTGPTIDGLMKPDITAPGTNVVSAISSYYREENPDELYYDVSHFTFEGRNYVWGAYSGTSMSCPIVAGVIALWLQACPTLTKEDIIALFSRTCKQPDPTLTYPNNLYGYGEIDAYKGLLDLLGLSTVKGLYHHHPQCITINPEGNSLNITFSRKPSSPVHLNVYNLKGAVVHQNILEGTTNYKVWLPCLPQGVYAIQMTSAEAAFQGSLLIRL